MRTNWNQRVIFICTLLFTALARGQSDNLGYAVTDSIPQGIKWIFLRPVNLKTGIYDDTLLRLINNSELMPGNGIMPFNGVAAIAHDKKNKRVYYTPMLLDRLSYVDLQTMTIHIVTNHFTGLMPKLIDQSNIFTRMVIADDGNGYAITNDGYHFIRFTTSSNPVINDLGQLTDDPGNHENSVHTICSSGGGDIISDDTGNLYLVTFANLVYKINIQSRVATYLGKVIGLPENFSTSGVAVDKTGNDYFLVLASSVNASSVYKLDLNTFAAGAINPNNGEYTADLTNSAILKTHGQLISSAETLENNENEGKIRLYPNPVISNEFKIDFTGENAGQYSLEIIDGNGQTVINRIIAVGAKNKNVVIISLPRKLARGVVFVRIINKENKTVLNEKLILL